MPIKRIADARRIGSIVLRDEEIFQRNLHPRVRNYHHCAREPERSVLCVNVRAYGCVLAAARRFLRRREAATVYGERMVHRPNGLTARAPGGRGCLSLVVHSEHTSSSGQRVSRPFEVKENASDCGSEQSCAATRLLWPIDGLSEK